MVSRWLSEKSFRRHAPLLTIIVVVYKMPVQAKNTIRSLLPSVQHGCREEEYEVIVVENSSDQTLDREFIDDLPGNFRYLLRRETAPTPVYAVNEAASLARSPVIGVMIDGARMVTPGVVRGMLQAYKIEPKAVVSVPGYHLGQELQQVAVEKGYDVTTDQQLLASSEWEEDGYRLFNIACFSGSCAGGFFLPNSESNCFAMPEAIWRALGGMDERFNLRGGGMVNLDFYRRACEHPGVQHVVLPGEGTFHQFHGGVTTGGEPVEAREVFIEQIKEQYRQLRGEDFASPKTNPMYLGSIHSAALRFLKHSADRAALAHGSQGQNPSGPKLVAGNPVGPRAVLSAG